MENKKKFVEELGALLMMFQKKMLKNGSTSRKTQKNLNEAKRHKLKKMEE